MSGTAKKKPLFRKLAERIARGGETPEREIFLCTGPDCCRREEGLAAWKHLQRRIREKGLSNTVSARRASCMNVCGDGPIAVVYPERTFYSRMNAKGLDALLKTHLRDGKPNARYAFEPPDDVREPPHRMQEESRIAQRNEPE